MYTKEEWKKFDKFNQILVKKLKKNIPLSELISLNKKHPGILHAFWRHNSSEVFFPRWYQKMQDAEKKLKPKIKEDIKKEEETPLEKIERKLKEIQERYS